MSDAVVRPVRPGELEALIDVNARAFAGTLGAALGRAYQARFLRFFIEGEDTSILVAEHAGKVGGLVYGAPDGYDQRLKRELRLVTALSFLRHPSAVLHPSFGPHLWRRFNARLGRPPPPRPLPPLPVFDLVGIGTAPEARGLGLAPALLDAFTREAFARGFASVVLDVYATNTRAVRVYESCGWVVLWSEGAVRRYVRAAEGAPTTRSATRSPRV